MRKKRNPQRDYPVTAYLTPVLKRRATKLASTDPRLSVSKLIEESLEMQLPELERKYGRGSALTH